MDFETRPLSAGPETTFTASQIRAAVQDLLALEGLPPIVQVGHPVLRQLAAAYDGQLEDTAAFRWDPDRHDFLGVSLDDHASAGQGNAR